MRPTRVNACLIQLATAFVYAKLSWISRESARWWLERGKKNLLSPQLFSDTGMFGPLLWRKWKRFFVCLSFKGKAIGLPDDFLALKEGSKGGGVIQVRKSSVMSSGKTLKPISSHRRPHRSVFWLRCWQLVLRPSRYWSSSTRLLKRDTCCRSWWLTAPKRPTVVLKRRQW